MDGKSRYFQDTLAVIEQIQGANNAVILTDAFSKALANFGYEHFCVVAAPTGAKQRFGDKLLLKQWPKSWYQHYTETELHFHDPISNFSRKQINSFAWSKVAIPTDDRLANQVMSISSHDYKMVHGYCVPIKGLHGHQATISMAGRDVDTHADANAAIDIISIFAFNRLLNIRAERDRPKLLTPREREIISWAASGKTAWDTSVILNISVETVNKTASSAMRKLNVHTRAQAAAEAMRLGEIEF